MKLTPNSIETIGFEIRTNTQATKRNKKLRFKSVYGTYPIVIYDLWTRLVTLNVVKIDDIMKLKRFFFMFDFLQNYCKETQCAMDFGVDEKTYRKWVWFFLEKVSIISKNVVSTRIENIYCIFTFITYVFIVDLFK